MNILSLFSGIGGFELGLERAGLGPVLWQSEIDRFCRRVLRHHWPSAQLMGDVRSVKAGRVPPVDLICGGFPCQGISSAGKGRGLEDERSGLWGEFARVIGELRPSWVVIENSPRITSRGLDRVLGDLAARGYDAAWDCVPASAVGAPHRRDRFYLVAWRVSDADGFELRIQPERGEGGTQATDGGDTKPCDMGEVLADPDRWRREAERIANRNPGDEGAPRDIIDGRGLPIWPPSSNDLRALRALPLEAQPALCPLAHGVPDEASRLRATGNAVVPFVAEVIGRLIVEAAA